jgi:hypothetical protein
MSKITIVSTEVKPLTGTSKRTGKPYSLKRQEATFESARERRVCMLMLGDEQPPYEPGVYEIDASAAFTVSQYGDIELTRVIPLRRVSDLPRIKAA